MKAEQFRTQTSDQLLVALSQLKKEQFNLRFQRATGQLEKTARVRQVRREVARIKTVLNQMYFIQCTFYGHNEFSGLLFAIFTLLHNIPFGWLRTRVFLSLCVISLNAYKHKQIDF